ncbi:MAG TPA: SRPBCC family protein [Vicinamibacterales bacterium]|nr:SRPBCC family protein [Vicinamibacterales bacterium]
MMTMTIEKAQVTLPSDREVRVTRSFKAPRALVYRAYTEPELVRRWLLGPPGWSMPVCEMDVRVGGRYRWRWRSDEKGSEFGFSGTFREVQPPSRLVHSEAYDPGTIGDDFPRQDALVTVTFADDGNVTTVTSLIDFGSKEARDAAIATGMTDGMEQSYQLLDRLLEQQPRA